MLWTEKVGVVGVVRIATGHEPGVAEAPAVNPTIWCQLGPSAPLKYPVDNC